MAKTTQHPLAGLKEYIPENSFDDVVFYLQKYKVHLTVTRQRTTKLGDYRNAEIGKNHRISVNGNLNKFAFLITLLHELAHLLTYEQYRHKVAPHGREWQQHYGNILAVFIQKGLFPQDIVSELSKSLHSQGASTCAEEGLMRILRQYDNTPKHITTIEELQLGDEFITRDGKIFRLGNKRRTRYECFELNTQNMYLVHGLYEVKKREKSLD